jgi:hypothetical protein
MIPQEQQQEQVTRTTTKQKLDSRGIPTRVKSYHGPEQAQTVHTYIL